LFSFEIAPGHFLNTDFAPPAPEREEFGKRRYSGFDYESRNDAKRYHQQPPPPPPIPLTSSVTRIDLSKMGERMCTVLARKHVIQESSGGVHDLEKFRLPLEVDICNRTKVDYAKNHLEKLGIVPGTLIQPGSDLKLSGTSTVVVWEFSAASERDCRGYDDLCDYFVSKDRIGFYSDSGLVVYFIPPVKQFLEPLGLPHDSRYLMAIQMPAASPTV
jgi:hypothetical protein